VVKGREGGKAEEGRREGRRGGGGGYLEGFVRRPFRQPTLVYPGR